MSDNLVDVFIEIPMGSNVKYEYDDNYKCVRCDRILNTALVYPANYGFIPGTLAGDGDPLDVLLITDYKLYPNIVIKCKIIGVLLTEDEEGEDNKVIVVPSKKVDPRYEDKNNYSDLDQSILDKINHFYLNYKTLEHKKWVKVHGYANRSKALDIYRKSLLKK
ncbi:inorganic pyrophosphatase [archaeon]|nr:inorganic pyrophosphatase [archaeon]|tara:strand:+ start:108 stop:596 length:489 start_codon:yes stop_codon:yes gene_type:complete